MENKKKPVRTKTKYPCIYQNNVNNKYDVKYNYTIYDPIDKKNIHKAKWQYGIATLKDAREFLAKTQSQGIQREPLDVSFEGAYQLWRQEALAANRSSITIKNTTQQFNMLCQFIDKDILMKDITGQLYLQVSSQCREHGYSEETLHSLNSCFRKLIKLCVRNKILVENVLDTCINVRTTPKDNSNNIIKKEEFDLIDVYFHTNKFIRKGVNVYPKYRFLYNLLYYTGIRIGEALALQYDDIIPVQYKTQRERDDELAQGKYNLIQTNDTLEEEHIDGWAIRVTKAYSSDFKISKDPKNYKLRTVPLPQTAHRLFLYYKMNHDAEPNSKDSDRIFDFTHSAATEKISTCSKKLFNRAITCHTFRHTYISNLLSNNVPIATVEKVSGDTQATILKRYSHMFESDTYLVLKAMNNPR